MIVSAFIVMHANYRMGLEGGKYPVGGVDRSGGSRSEGRLDEPHDHNQALPLHGRPQHHRRSETRRRWWRVPSAVGQSPKISMTKLREGELDNFPITLVLLSFATTPRARQPISTLLF